MKKMQLLICLLLLVLLVAACTGSEEIPDKEPKMDGMEEKEIAIDYCDLPAGTRVTWFDQSTFIFIPESIFQMGYDDLAGDYDYEPSHAVNLGAFWMHETEVTNRQFANCVAAGRCAPPEQFPDVPYWYEDTERLDDPVAGITWEQVDAYCEWIGTRLPTEAEWELAARGVNDEPYPWGTDVPDCEHANYLGCLDPEDPQPYFAGLLDKGISPFEMLDMAGNVNEWVSDWYAEDYYQNSPSGNPTGPDTGELRVWRGGDYQSPAEELLSYLRGALAPEEAQPDLGFRCAWSCGEDVPPGLCQFPPAVEVSRPVGGGRRLAKPEITGDGYCEWRDGVESAGVVIESNNGVDLSQYDFSSPDGPITCDPVGDKVVCHGPGITPGGQITIVVCPDCGPSHYFDSEAGACYPLQRQEPDSSGGPESGLVEPGDLTELEAEIIELLCPPGYHFTSYCGCIPDGVACEVGSEPSEVVVEVPVGDPGDRVDLSGYFTGTIGVIGGGESIDEANPLNPDGGDEDCENNGLLRRCPPNTFPLTTADGCQVCIPLRTMSDCPLGFYFNKDANCCVPETFFPGCPEWTYWDEVDKICKPIISQRLSCEEITVKIPGCGPPPEKPSCVNPDQYNNQNACEENYCKWYKPYRTRPGSCIMP